MVIFHQFSHIVVAIVFADSTHMQENVLLCHIYRNGTSEIYVVQPEFIFFSFLFIKKYKSSVTWWNGGAYI